MRFKDKLNEGTAIEKKLENFFSDNGGFKTYIRIKGKEMTIDSYGNDTLCTLIIRDNGSLNRLSYSIDKSHSIFVDSSKSLLQTIDLYRDLATFILKHEKEIYSLAFKDNK